MPVRSVQWRHDLVGHARLFLNHTDKREKNGLTSELFDCNGSACVQEIRETVLTRVFHRELKKLHLY